MVEVKDSVKHLLGLFEHRDKMVEACTRKITRFLDPLLSTIRRMLNADEDSFVTKNTYVSDDVLAVTFVLTYDPNEEMTPFLKLLHVSSPEMAVREITRTLTLGVPLDIAFSEPDTLERWLMKTARDAFDPDATAVPEKTEAEQAAPPPDVQESPKDPTAFDPSLLTAEQASQLLFFQQITKGVKQ